MFGILQHISENLNNVEMYRCKSGAYDLTGKLRMDKKDGRLRNPVVKICFENIL